MPSTMTHTYFGLDVKKQLPTNIQNIINQKIEHYKLFCQGSDPFMFRNFLIGKKAQQSMKIQKRMHETNTKDFFINTIKLIHKKKYINNPEIMTYLYGYICHYYLDLYTHPFIHYKTGIFNKKNKNTYKYNGMHQKIEYNIDLYMVKQREKQKPHQFKIYHHIFQNVTFSKELTEIINQSIEQTYQIHNISYQYQKSIHHMKLFFQWINHDPTGIKLKIYQLIDSIKPKKYIKLEELSYHHDFESNLTYLNLEHKPWHYPWDKTKVFTTSFFDLYNKAKEDAIKTICIVTKMLEENKINQALLDKTFLNLSYSTGKPCQEKIEMKYFEY